jgi:hypothetical protein
MIWDPMTRTHRVLPAISAILACCLAGADMPPPPAEQALARRSRTNLQQIALALHNFNERHETLPPAASSKSQNKPPLSWRVHILPLLNEQALYDEFRLFEPWDSEHNRKLIPKMPAVYRVPLTDPLDPGKTCYLVPVGHNTLFPPPESDRGSVSLVRDVYDGLPNTILLVEANRELAQPWTKPQDLDYDPEDPVAGLGGLRPAGFLAVWGNGRVTLVPATLGSERADRTEFLDSLFGRSDGKGVPFLLKLD